MIDEPTAELASLHALGLLEGAEKSAFETALARDPALRRLVRELREAAAQLSFCAPDEPPPSPELKARLLARIAVSRAPAAPARVAPFAASVWIPWALAACLALAAAWLGRLYLGGQTELVALRTQESLARVESRSFANQLEAERILSGRRIADLHGQLKAQDDLAALKITALASLLGNSPQARAIAVWDPARQAGVLTVEKLPALAGDQSYQLWVIDPQYAHPVSGGIFSVGADGWARFTFKPAQPIATAAKFAVSRERKGGELTAPRGPIVLASE